jgi:hypothetical protein
MIKIELTEEEWSRALTMIGQGPYVQVAQLIEKIARQIQERKSDDGKVTPLKRDTS